MHEHLLVGWAGWELDCKAPRFDRKTALKTAVDRLKELKDLGLSTFVDPCPNDIGRDVVFMAEIADASGVNIICTTGLYKEDLGNTVYMKQRSSDEIAEIYTAELTEGIGETGIKAGLIKCATGKDQITEYEEKCLRAAARASKRTGAPITTHTDEGTMGREQLNIFESEGVNLSKVIIGHSCGSSDLGYHTDMLDRGCYLGFDRFGLEFVHPDRLRTGGADRACWASASRSSSCFRTIRSPAPRARAWFAARRCMETDQELESDAHFQEYAAEAEGSGVPDQEDQLDDGRESAPLLRSLSHPTKRDDETGGGQTTAPGLFFRRAWRRFRRS